jgi:hypothetical protein
LSTQTMEIVIALRLILRASIGHPFLQPERDEIWLT